MRGGLFFLLLCCFANSLYLCPTTAVLMANNAAVLEQLPLRVFLLCSYRFLFVRFPLIYKGGRTNKHKHVLCPRWSFPFASRKLFVETLHGFTFIHTFVPERA